MQELYLIGCYLRAKKKSSKNQSETLRESPSSYAIRSWASSKEEDECQLDLDN